MDGKMNKKYGLFTAMAMVIGIVIGSGVFFKAEKVLNATGGNLPIGILAWVVGGLIMIVCAYNFALLATRHEKVNGLVDYAEVSLGSKYGYFVGWFMAVIYLPALTSVLAWVSARYLGSLFGLDMVGPQVMTIAGTLLICSFCMNTLGPIMAGKFQVSTTVIKLIPLALMAVVGIIAGLINGVTVENFTTVVNPEVNPITGLTTGIVAAAFAYEGWIIATSINAEIKDAKKNLPLALVGGTAIIAIIYIAYYIGLAGTLPNAELMSAGENGVKQAFSMLFGNIGGTLLMVFIIISCLGTLNGLMLGCVRGLYGLSVRGVGPKPSLFSQVDKITNMPTNSSVFGLLMAGFWLLYFYGANLGAGWFVPFNFDSSELPIVTLYLLYIPMFIANMIKDKEVGVFNRFVMPSLAIICCIVMVAASIIAHKKANLYYGVVFLVIMLIGMFFMNIKQDGIQVETQENEQE